MKIDGSLSYKGKTTTLQEIMIARRSVRKYLEGGVTAEHREKLLLAHSSFCEKMGYKAPRIAVEIDKEMRDRIISAACTGLIGKGNPWLPLTKAQGVIVAASVCSLAPVFGDHKLGIAQASMAMEVVVLAATEMGLGTCWLAAVNHSAVEKALGLPEGHEVIAVAPLGTPVKKISLLSWDGVTFHMLSKRRKPIGEILFNDRLGNEYHTEAD